MSNIDRRVLVVDDDTSIHRAFRQCLGSGRNLERGLISMANGVHGVAALDAPASCFDLEFAVSGEDALAMTLQAIEEKRPFAMAFMDLRLDSAWDGIETTARIWEVDSDLPVVICTAFSDSSSLAEISARLGHSERFVILAKPFGAIEVQQLANAFIEKRRLQNRIREQVRELTAARADLEEKARIRSRQLARAQIRFEHLLRSSPAIIYSVKLVNPQGISFISEKLSDVLGYSVAEFTATPDFWFQHLHPDDAAQTESHRAELLKTGRHPVEYRFLHRDGTYRWIHDDARIIRDEAGSPAEIVGYIIDITERKSAEEALRASERRYRNLVDCQGEGVVTTDADQRFSFANPAAEQILGAWPGQLVGRKLDEFLGPRERELLLRQIELRKAGRKTSYELEILAGTGERKHILVTGVPQTDASGKYTGSFAVFRDVTVRKQAERALRENQRLMRAILDNIPDAAWLKDAAGRYLVGNQPLATILGLGLDRLIRRSDRGSPPDLAAQLSEGDNQVKSARLPVRSEVSFRTPGGDTRCFDTIESPILNEQGEVASMVGVARDITERKRSDDKLRLQTSALEAAANGIVITDRAGLIEWVNPAFTRLTGYPAGEAIGKRPAFLKSGKHDQAFYARMWNTIVAGNPWQGEMINRRKDGTEYCEEMTITPVRGTNGEIEHFVAIKQDITDRKKVEAALATERDLLQALMTNLPDYIYFKDLNSRFLRCSKTQADRFGLATVEDVIGKTDFDFFSEEHARPAFEDEQEIIRTGHAVIGKVEEEVSRGEGASAWVLTSKLPMRNHQGEIIGTFGVSKDITALKQAELARQTMEVQLRQSQKLEAVGQLASGIAHEINTPTQYVGDNTRFLQDAFGQISATLGSFAELLAAAKQGQATPELIERVEKTIAASDLAYLSEQIPAAIRDTLEGVERVTRIVRAMREFSHPGASAKVPAGLNKAIDSTITVARNEWKYVADMVLELEPGLPLVPCFVGEFNQVILNLVINAAQAVGEVVKAVPGSKGTITIRTRTVGESAEIRVSDTGPGIPEAIRGRIFEPFFTTKDVGKGTGQGLTIVYGSVVRKHGGTVTFESEMGVGTTFIVRLPLHPRTPTDVHQTIEKAGASQCAASHDAATAH